MVRGMRLYLVLVLSVFLSACAPVIFEEIRGEIDTSVSFKEVVQNPNSYQGKIVLWGGEIIQTLSQKDGSTLIEVLEWPLGWTERPRRTVSFQGEFLVLLKEPVSPSFYRKGEKITVVGEILGSIQGEEIKSISDPTYRYPLLVSKEIHLWKWHLYPYSSVPDERGTWEYREYGGILHY
jgi:outer membrane lipoprotein